LYVLAIESSCDETAAAVVSDDLQVLSNVVASQARLHERFGGVVPEIASRAHVERIVPVVDQALWQAGIQLGDVGAIAVVTTPGLVGSLLIGLTAAKSIALVLGVPLVAVNHLEAHVYACRLAAKDDVFPCVALVVSGGHTSLYRCESPLEFQLLGATTDDAAGEAFDKVASLMGLGYPGGPAIDKAARVGNRFAYRFPRSFLNDPRLDFSFSGLKTAVLYTLGGQDSQRPSSPLSEQQVADLAASFQEAVVDVLIAKAAQALDQTGCDTLCVGGGVAANTRFRQRLDEMALERGIRLFVPPLWLCTDNAAMAAIAIERLQAGLTESLSLDVQPGLERMRQ
jgi:N6-L-threonylcarbamoyladenine synthase